MPITCHHARTVCHCESNATHCSVDFGTVLACSAAQADAEFESTVGEASPGCALGSALAPISLHHAREEPSAVVVVVATAVAIPLALIVAVML